MAACSVLLVLNLSQFAGDELTISCASNVTTHTVCEIIARVDLCVDLIGHFLVNTSALHVISSIAPGQGNIDSQLNGRTFFDRWC